MTTRNPRQDPAGKRRAAVALPQAAAMRRRLLAWYDRNRRELPWRRSSDPYRVWISEIMLQQTRVQAVIPYYERFLRHFPDVASLASASEQELLSCWSGLGYYSRARNLQRAAKMIVAKHDQQFPRELRDALALPGIGAYTSAAVLSIAYGAPLAVLDGNVARVLSRLLSLPADLKTTVGREQLSKLASQLLSRRRPGDFNQAMMELGAVVCLPQQPRCDTCPIRVYCSAHLRGRVAHYPPARQKPAVKQRGLSAALVTDRAGRYLMVRRPQDANWMAGFWELPTWENGAPPRAGLLLTEHLGTVRHTITDNRILVSVWKGTVRAKIPQGRWISREEFASHPITTITRKALALTDPVAVTTR